VRAHKILSSLYQYTYNTNFQVRNWWNMTEKKTASIVEKFTCAFVTPTLWSEEVESVQQSKASFDNMTVTAILNETF
jgi:hypothetical protein